MQFETVVVGIDGGEHKTPEFKKLNPKGKVPCLIIDGEPLTENVAILTYLNRAFPEANILTRTANLVDELRQTADLAFCSGGLHLLATRIRMSHRFVENPTLAPQVRAAEIDAMKPNAAFVDEHLSRNRWWYGEQWSIMDAYRHWIWHRITGSGFPEDDYPNWADHYRQQFERPSMQRMLDRKQDWQQELSDRGMAFPEHPTLS